MTQVKPSGTFYWVFKFVNANNEWIKTFISHMASIKKSKYALSLPFEVENFTGALLHAVTWQE